MTPAIWRPAAEAIAPVEWSWRCENNGEVATIKLQMDLRKPSSTLDEIRNGLENLWRSVWAPLVTKSTVCTLTLSSPLTVPGGGLSFVPPLLRGDLDVPAAPRRDSVIVMNWVGGRGSVAHRRTYLPFVPASWIAGDVLTSEAFGILLTSVRGLVLGCDGARGGAGPSLIMWHRPVPSTRYQIPRPAEFAEIQQMIVNAYVDRAPDGS